ncbi:MAG TPA: insulinase family protein [Blastocatellia bacterium]|nr:insulinase family protein [Blastocatellia bacterium]
MPVRIQYLGVKSASLWLAVGLAVGIALVIAVPALAQSGRGRPHVPVPTSAPSSPATTVSVPEATGVVKQEELNDLSRFVLRNGITVIISEQHALPIAVAVSYLKTGLRQTDTRLLASALQQAILAGQPNGSSQSIPSSVRALGGVISADSSYDGTYFSMTVPSSRIKDALSVGARIVGPPSLSPDQAAEAFQDSAAADQSLCYRPSELALERVHDLSLYGPSTASAVSSGESVSAPPAAQPQTAQERLLAFYSEIYRPENLVIAVAGDVSTFDTLVDIQRLYGAFGAEPAPEPANQDQLESKGARPAHPDPSATGTATHGAASNGNIAAPVRRPAQKPESSEPVSHSGTHQTLAYSEERGEIAESIAAVGYRVPGLASNEWPVVEVLAAMIGQGPGSLLHSSLFYDEAIASRTESTYLALAASGVLSVQLWMPHELIDKAESTFFKSIDNLRENEPAPDEMARARMVAEKLFDDEIATYSGRALFFARAAAAGTPLKEPLDYIRSMHQVSPGDIHRAAEQYLGVANTSVFEYEPFEASPRTFDAARFARAVEGWAPGLAQPLAMKPPPPKPPATKSGAKAGEDTQAGNEYMESIESLPVRDFSTLNGPQAYVREDHSRRTVAVALLFQTGRVNESASNSGITELMLRTIMFGTPRVTPKEVARQLDQLGAEVEIVTEPDFFGFVVSSVSANASRSLKIVRDLIEEPAFRGVDLERARVEQIAAIQEEGDDGPAHAQDLMLQSMLPGHAYGLPRHGFASDVAKIKIEDLRAWYNKWVKDQYPLVTIVGDTDGSALVSEGIAGQFVRRELTKTFQAVIPRQAMAGEKIEQHPCEGNASPAIVRLGLAGPKTDSQDLPTFDVIQALLNGAGGLLEDQLSYKERLAWQAKVTSAPGLAIGVIGVDMEVESRNLARSQTAVAALLQRLGEQLVPVQDIESARAIAKTLALVRLHSQSERALDYARALYAKRQASYVDSYTDLLDKVTAADIQRVASTYFKSPRFAGGMLVRPEPPKPAPASPASSQ